MVDGDAVDPSTQMNCISITDIDLNGAIVGVAEVKLDFKPAGRLVSATFAFGVKELREQTAFGRMDAVDPTEVRVPVVVTESREQRLKPPRIESVVVREVSLGERAFTRREQSLLKFVTVVRSEIDYIARPVLEAGIEVLKGVVGDRPEIEGVRFEFVFRGLVDAEDAVGEEAEAALRVRGEL